MKKINIEEKIYPDNLRRIENPPKQLYLEGNIKLLNSIGIGIVGSRNCSEYGRRMTKRFAKALGEYSITIISGMAVGIDSLAHTEAIKNGTYTIAVLPSGLKNIYPKENIKLYKEILANNGLVITEYDEKHKAQYQNFLDRNRIVSGLSIGILVVEGGHRSGTSVTAKLALEQNKKVFCIPSSLENPKGITPNRLIKEDILEEYPELEFKIKEISQTRSIPEEYQDIYNIIKYNGKININEIVRKTKINIKEVNYKLMMLELEEKIVALPGKNFEIQ